MKYFRLIEKDFSLDKYRIASKHIFFSDHGTRGGEFFQGKEIKNWDSNNAVILKGNGALMGVLGSSWNLMIVSEEMRCFLATVEPEYLQFLPVRVYSPADVNQNIGLYYIVNILSPVEDAIIQSESVFDYEGAPITVFLDYSKIGKRTFFRIKEMPYSLFASDEIVYVLKKIVPGYYEYIEV